MSTHTPDSPIADHDHPPGPQSRPVRDIITATTLPSPALRKAAIISFIPALPLCITHGMLSKNIVPSLGLIPLFFSASASVYLLVAERALARVGKGKQPRGTDEPDVEASPDEAQVQGEGRATGATSILTHRIFVFFLDLVVAASLMVVLVFSWVGVAANGRADLAMLAAYSTVPLLANFLIHSYTALREFSAGLALPGLVEYVAWRAVPPDCPHCGNRLRPDTLPPVPWYETVSRPRLSVPALPAVPRPPPVRPLLTSVRSKLPSLSSLRPKREWKVTTPSWLRIRRGEEEQARLFVDSEHDEDHEPYTDDPIEPYPPARSTTTVVATGPVRGEPVEEAVVATKKTKRSPSDLFGDEPSWA